MTGKGSDNKTDKVDGRRTRRGKRGPYKRHMIEGADLLKRYAMLLMCIMEHLDIPVYRTNKSNHIYSYRQKICLLVLRKRLRLSYNQFVIDLPSYPTVLEEIGLTKSVPDKTTLIKFSGELHTPHLISIVAAFEEFVSDNAVIALDGTGFSNFLRSAHFVKRCKELNVKEEPRTFTKGSFVVDTDTHIVLSARFSAERRNDVTFVEEHLSDLDGVRVSCALMDKGYDSEMVHKLFRFTLGCETIIPCRKSRNNRGFSVHGVYRNQMRIGLQDKEGEMKRKYNRRPQVETTNFMMKTHMGSHILSKKDRTKENEGYFMAMAHNCKVAIEKGLVGKAKS